MGIMSQTLLGGKSTLKSSYLQVGPNAPYRTRQACSRSHGCFEVRIPVGRVRSSREYIGIAPEAKISKKDAGTFTGESSEWLNLRDTDIANLSFSTDGQIRGHVAAIKWYWDDTRAKRDSAAGTLIVKAAGNSGRETDYGHINNGLLKSDYASSTLIVGATISHTDTRLASYSSRPGDNVEHQNNFVVDSGQSMYPGRIAAGTSWAAPRVSGKAAIIKSKFRNMTATQLADVIKNTADDLGAPGVDSVFGHGKINLGRALSPIGNIN